MKTRTLILLALCLVTLHTLTNGRYGFHRDELATLDDARYLARGYAAYPPVTPFIGRVARDVRIGPADGFLRDQLMMNLLTFPLSLAPSWAAGAAQDGEDLEKASHGGGWV